MTKFEKPEWMTVDEAGEKFHTNSYIMINCAWEGGTISDGEAIAYAPLKNGGVLSQFKQKIG